MLRTRIVAVVAVMVLAGAVLARAISAPRGQTAPPKAKAKLFAPQDLGLLEPADRDQWQKPDLIMDAVGIADGSVVADVGAGGGWFTVRLARRVGPNGLVYAEDIQPQMIEAIYRHVQTDNLLNVRTVLGTVNDPRLPSGIDAVMIVDAYHEIQNPVTLLRALARSLKPEGRLGIVAYAQGGGGPGPAPDERVDEQSIVSAADAAGFQLAKREPIPPFLFLLVFGKKR